MIDYYVLLGIPRFTDSLEDIKNAYRKQIMFFHPDKGHVSEEIALEKTQELNVAYDTLRDSTKKAEYDKALLEFIKYGSQSDFDRAISAYDVFKDTIPRYEYGHFSPSYAGGNYNASAKTNYTTTSTASNTGKVSQGVGKNRGCLIPLVLVILFAVVALINEVITPQNTSTQSKDYSTSSTQVTQTNNTTVPSKEISIIISPSQTRVAVGDSITLGVKLGDVSQKDSVIWESSDSSVATIKDGVVKAISVGTVKLTVKLPSGSSSSATIQVVASDSASADAKPELIPVSVKNGQILKQPLAQGLAPFEVKTSQGCNYYIYLKDVNGKNDVAFYVVGGNTVEIDVPLGTYECYYCCGDTWYGTDAKFGDDTRGTKANSTFRFYETSDSYMGHTITLYVVQNGNLSTSTIDMDDFPD